MYSEYRVDLSVSCNNNLFAMEVVDVSWNLQDKQHLMKSLMDYHTRFPVKDSGVFLCLVDVLVSAEDLMAVPVFKKNLTICVNLRAGRERV